MSGRVGQSWRARVPWVVWAVTTLVALVYAWSRGRRFAFADDWDAIVPVLIGKDAGGASWVWSQQNEHRLPVLRLGQLLSVSLAGGDFRASIVLGVLFASAAAVALLVVVRTWRGHTLVADACIPLALLRLNNSSFGWGGQLHFIASMALSVGVLCTGPGIALVLLPLCGANGLVLALPFALVFGAQALVLREPGWRRCLAYVLATLVVIAVYFVGWHTKPHPWTDPDLSTTLAMIGRYLGAAGNPSFAPLWPLDGLVIFAWVVLVAVALAARWRDDEWARRLALFVALQLLLAVVIGRARGGRGWLPDLGYNYASLALGLLAGLVVATLVATPPRARQYAHAALLAFLAVPYCITTPLAFASPEVRVRVQEARELEAELRRGDDPAVLAVRHDALLAPSSEARRAGFVADSLALRARQLMRSPAVE